MYYQTGFKGKESCKANNMRAAELLHEGQGYVLNGIEELVVRAKARGITKLKTSTLLAKLEAGGYFIDMGSLVKLLNSIDAVGSANKNEITLTTALPPDSEKKDDETVSKMASKQLSKKDKKL